MMSIAEKLTAIAENVQKVYDAGKAAGGGGDGGGSYDEGYIAGREAEHGEFWDSFLNKGNRIGFGGEFEGEGWNDETFAPTYDICPVGDVGGIFRNCKIINLKGIIEKQEVKLDFSKAGTASWSFRDSTITHLGVIDFSSVTMTSGTYMFYGCKNLIWVDEFIRDKALELDLSTDFNGCNALQHIIFNCTIAKSFSNLAQAPLDHDSTTSLVDSLSATATGQTLTVSKKAVNTAFETAVGLADGSTSDEWLNLIATKANWTISLV